MQRKGLRNGPTADGPFLKFLTAICLIAFIGYAASQMRLPVVPLHARSLGLDTSQIGWINSGFFLMAGCLSLPLGMLSDRWGRKRMAGCGLLLLSGTSFLLCYCQSFTQFSMIYLLFGIGIAAFGPTMMSMVASISPITHLGRSYGWYTTALYCGMSIGPAVGGVIAQAMGALHVFVVSGLALLLNCGAMVIFLPHASATGTVSGEGQLSSSIGHNMWRNRPLLGCWLATLGGCFGLGMFLTFIPLFAQNQGLTAGQIGMVFFAQGICNALSRIPLGHLSDQVSDRKKLVGLGLIGLAVAMAGFSLSNHMTTFTVWAAVMGLSMALAFTSIGALISETVPPTHRGLAMGGYNSVIFLGLMLSSGFMGPIIQKTSFWAGFWIAGIIILGMIFGFYHLIKHYVPPSVDLIQK